MKNVAELTALVVQPGESVPRVSSRQIAEAFDKSHKNVLAGIGKILAECPTSFGRLNFKPSNYMNSQNKPQKEYLLTRTAFCILSMRFTGVKALTWQIRYSAAFDEMEDALRQRQLTSGPEGRQLVLEGLRMARRLTPERKREIKSAVRYKALGLDNPVIGRILGCGRDKVRKMLWENEILTGGQK